MNIQTIEDQWYEQAIRLHSAGKLGDAEALYRQILARRPAHGEALFGLGTLAHQCGRNDVAVQLFAESAKTIRNSALYNNMGEAYRGLGRGEEAAAAFRTAIEINPVDHMPHNNLGIVLCLMGKLREAEESWRKAISLKADYTDAMNNLGNAMLDMGAPEEAERLHRQVIAIQPGFARAHSNLLRDLNHIHQADPVAIRREHEAWWAAQARGITPLASWPNSRDPNRPLRIGLVSPDFREHSVAYFLEPWLANRDRPSISVTCYAELPVADRVTERLAKLVEGWCNTMGTTDEALAKQIVSDKIDILIDLAGHTASNRLRVFAFKPAPVQVSFLGYPFTTGGRTIDYKLTDAQADPPGVSESAYTETPFRLPVTNWCYRAPANAPDVAPPPAAANGFVTFGSFNNYSKVNAALIAAWSDLLKRVPRSRLLLKANTLGDAGVQQKVAAAFAAHGIGSDRVTLRGRVAETAGHLAQYAEVDIALDTFPYNGTTTTCEALWMGVPVITRAGDLHIERVGASLLHSVGLDAFVTTTREAYTAAAAELAGDLPRLSELRRTMRSCLRASPLTDERAYARDFDAALRTMWQTWCR